MKTLQKTFFLIAIFVLATQAIRFVYIKCFEDHASVLDTYDTTSLDSRIRDAQSLDDLLEEYGRARQHYAELDRQRDGLPKDQRQEFTDAHSDEFQEETKLKYAIVDWENKAGEITELRVFWFLGLLLALGGAALYWRGFRWIGMGLIIPGFTEMIWWTSPSLSLGGALREFDRLMNNKIFFALAALILLIAAWVLSARLRMREGNSEL